MVPISAVVCLSLLVLAEATNVHQCKGQNTENLSEKVQLSPCEKPPCRLRKGTEQFITIHFTPDEDMNDLTNSVKANLFGADVPFVGVDGNSVCDKVFTADDEKASCPLKAGTEYTYKDSFPVYSFYPSVTATVKWSLKHGNTDLTCFEVPVKITK